MATDDRFSGNWEWLQAPAATNRNGEIGPASICEDCASVGNAPPRRGSKLGELLGAWQQGRGSSVAVKGNCRVMRDFTVPYGREPVLRARA
jgi:hypothetical protein